MSSEIKIIYEDVEQALSKLRTSSQAMEPSLPVSIGGNNVLEVVTKVNDLNHSLQQLAEAYQTLLLNNGESTSQSVQTMKETDDRVAASIIQSS